MPNNASKGSSLLKLLAVATAACTATTQELPRIVGLTNFTIDTDNPQPWAPNASVIGDHVDTLWLDLRKDDNHYELQFPPSQKWHPAGGVWGFNSTEVNLNTTLQSSLVRVVDPKNPPREQLRISVHACVNYVCGPHVTVYGSVNQTALAFKNQQQAQENHGHALRNA